MKIRHVLMFMLAVVCCTLRVHGEELPIEVSAQAAIIYDADYGQVLYAKHADEKMLIASTTKIMTAVVVLEQCDPNEVVHITDEMTNVEGSSMYLQSGKDYTVKQLLYGLMLASGNDAATALAIHVAADEHAFAEMMNEKAKMLGLANTSFANPHGLDDTNHYSTAFDMACLMAYAMNDGRFAEIVGARSVNIQNLTYVNHNKLLWQCEGVIGGKTGYTMAAGRTLVTCCEREGQRLICVTLSASDDWNDHKRMYDLVYDAYEPYVLAEKDTRYLIPLFTGEGKSIAAEPLCDVTVFTASLADVECTVELPKFAFAPIYRGDYAGRILVKQKGKTVEVFPLVYMENYGIENTMRFRGDEIVYCPI